MSSLEDGTRKTAAVCTNCDDMYVVHIGPDGTVNPIGVSGCSCGDGELRPVQ